jgi:MYXO-CTERM domain-containing protein
MWCLLQVALAANPPAPGLSDRAPIDAVDAPRDEVPGDEAGAPPEPPARHNPQIINGEPASRDLYPETGGILFGGTITVPGMFGGGSQTVAMRSLICSSTLIAPDVVIAAAHCVDEYVLSQGGTVEDPDFRWSRKADLTSPSTPMDPWPDDAVRVRSTHVPPRWDIAAMNDFGLDAKKNDVALLFLDEPVLDVQPAVLATVEESNLVEGMTVDIVGWGMQKKLSILDSFVAPEPGSFGEKRWGTTTLHEIGEFEFQVGNDEEPRKCKGDSGGATFLPVDAATAETYRLIGVTSRSADFTLCTEKGGFDTRLDAYLDWIDETMRAGCEDGSRSWCDTPGILEPTLLGDVDDTRRSCATAPTPAGPGAIVGLLAALGWTRRRR